ncbi:hypothetical protein DBT_1924 [Dissulfuribacter thermophilus]|uniref:DUF1232 domain-containing protein n=1 Tax=Dissulfuribacter thermophilus TaxID=1156395 RepID=A0A1B9F3U2_9BACT|nr:DUF1232 domain-containing protein [Dissulfuribacter thermophilus]OCC14609.1 hypothetical protein DBT_1924 [Dissulfuribacter thermophilus]
MDIKGFLKLIPKFLALLVNLLKDSRVSSTDKAILATVVAYALNPMDLVPDWIPFFGLVDDLYLIALALFRLLARVDEEVLREYWQGPEDVIVLIKKALDAASHFLPPKLRRALIANVEKEE